MICRKSDSNSIEIVSKVLKSGGTVIVPTDTIYGFSGLIDITEEKIRKIKGRAETKPFIQLIANPEDIFKMTFDKVPEKIMNLWPGPLTVIVKSKENDSIQIAYRCPGDEWLRNIIAACGRPIYSTSVNRSGKPIINKIDEIIREFENETDLIVNDGDCTSSSPSTIVMIDNGEIKTIRQGILKIN